MYRLTKFKKRLWFTSLVLFFLLYFTLPINLLVLAQEATGSAISTTPTLSPFPSLTTTPTPTDFLGLEPALTATPTQLPLQVPTPTATNILAVPTTFITPEPTSASMITTTPTLAPTLFIDESPVSNSSATTKQPVKTKLLSNNLLKANESVILELTNTEANSIKGTLLRENELIQTTMRQELIWGANVLVVEPPFDFKPGKYQLIITDSLGNIETQEFYWGVLAINTNKSVYLPQETANLSIAVLDEQGKMVCDAKVELKISNQQLGIDDLLSTENGKIKVNPECQSHEFTLKPDYETQYQVAGVGSYKLSLSAETQNGLYAIEDGFQVKESVPFVVERMSATRIYPPHKYPVSIKVTANQDFNGEMIETVPEEFNISIIEDSSVLSFDKIENLNEIKKQTLLGEEVVDLNLPFVGNFPINLEFGEIPSDPGLQAEYQKFGAIGHDGVDFALPEGTEILSVDKGEVVQAGEGDYGITVIVKHSWGLSYYGHLKEVLVAEGQKVNKGDLLATSGDSGFSTGPHLHLSFKPNNPNLDNGFLGKVDPAIYLGVSKKTSQTKNIVWKVNLKKGETVNLGYWYQAPPESPMLYLLGPLQLLKGDQIVFQEIRQWQIAVDAVTKWLTHRSTETVDSVPAVTSNANMSQTAQESTNETVTSSYSTTTGSYLLPPGGTGTLGTPGSTPQGTGWWTAYPYIGSSASANWTFKVTTTSDNKAAGCYLRVIAYTNTRRSTTGATQLFDTGSNMSATNLCNKGTGSYSPTYNPGAINLTTTSPSGTGKYILFEYWLIVTSGSNGGALAIGFDGTSDTSITPEGTNTFDKAANITGTIYSDEGITAITTSPAVAVYKDNTQCTSCTGTADASGVYNLAVQTPSSGNTITAYIDNDGTYKGSLVGTYYPALTAADAYNMTGMNVYHGRVIARGSTGGSVTNTDFADRDNTTDADLLFYSSTTPYTCRGAGSYTGLCVDATRELHAWTGQTFAPGGNVTTDNMHLVGTYTGASEILNLSGSGTGDCTTAPGTIRPLCIDGGTYTPTSNTTKFSGSSNSNISATTYYDLTFAAASGTPAYSLLGTTTVSRDLLISAGNLSPGSSTLNVARNWTNNATFTKGTSSVVLNGGGGTTQTIAGSTEFYDLTATAATARTITFTQSTTQTITHALTLTGSAGQILTLQSSGSPTKWNINTTGIVSPTLDYLYVSDSYSTLCIYATNSSGADNTNWDFTGGGCAGPVGPTNEQLMRHGGWFNNSGVRQPFTF